MQGVYQIQKPTGPLPLPDAAAGDLILLKWNKTLQGWAYHAQAPAEEQPLQTAAPAPIVPVMAPGVQVPLIWYPSPVPLRST